MSNNVIVPIDEEIHTLLPMLQIEFITMIINLHNSYTNQKHTTEGYFGFMYELMSDILNNKVTVSDERIMWLVNGANDMGIDNTAEYYINKIKENTDYELLCYQIEAIDVAYDQVLRKYNLVDDL